MERASSPVKAKSVRVETRGNFSGFIALRSKGTTLIDPTSQSRSTYAVICFGNAP